MESIFLDEVSNKILSKSLTFIETMTNIRDSTDLLIFDTLLKITTSSRLFFFFFRRIYIILSSNWFYLLNAIRRYT